MRKKPSRKSFRVGIDARLAYRRGVGTYTANLILSLSKIDRRNEYFLFNAPQALRAKVSNRRFHWENLPFSNAAYYEQVLLPRAAVERGIDFLHYVDNSASAISDVPFILTLHDTMHTRPLSDVRPNPTLRQRLIHSYKQWAIVRATPRAQALLTVSEYSRGQILSQPGIRPERVRVTPEGVDRASFKKTKKKPSGLFKILIHGAADERKNIPHILKAAKILAGWKLNFQMVIIGMDDAEMKCTDYLQRTMALDLGRQVEWAGRVPFEMLNQVYSEADLFLYPSRLEGFGLPVLEAFACGVPVITSNTSSLPEVAGKAALLVDPESPRAIAEAVRKIMKNPRLRRQLIRRGLKRARLFSWDKTAKLTLKAYQQMEF